MNKKYVISLILVIVLFIIPAGSAVMSPALEAASSTIPTFSIVSVVKDTSVTIQTQNFPANRTFVVRMGLIGTRAIGGTIVATTDSGAGGSFRATYTIPDNLKGQAQISIRMDSTTGGFFSYNFFSNVTTGATATPGGPTATPRPTSTPGPSPTPGRTISGIPTFSISSVVQDQSVTIKTNNFPANRTFTARMGKIGTRAIGGTVVGSLDSGQGGTLSATFNIPDSLKGLKQISIRLDSTTGGFFAYNWFWNNTAGPGTTPAATSTPGPTRTPAPTFTGIPTFRIASVVRDQSVTITTNNFPANRTFTARMGAFGTRAIGGTVVGTLDSGSGGTLTATFNVPDSLKGSRQIAIRLDSTTGGFFAYNWFYNNTTP